MATTSNLTPWKKGQSGNPTGRPKAIATQVLREVVSRDHLEAIWRMCIEQAKQGDPQDRATILDRLEGMAIQRQEQGDPGAFEPDLSDVDTSTLKRALRRVE